MKVLVTGGAGYIGSHLCVELLQNGNEVVVLDDLVNSQVESLNRVQELTGKYLTFYKGDVRDSLVLNKLFRQYQFDCVIHLAAWKSVTESLQSPIDYYDNNVSGTIMLLQIMKKYQVNQIIYSSSIGIYGEVVGELIREDSKACFPENPYLATKFIGEQLVRGFVNQVPKMKGIILGYGNLAGAHESGAIGECPINTKGSLFGNLCDSAWERKPFVIFGDHYPTKDGSASRDYIHVSDVVVAHRKAMEHFRKMEGVEKFLLTRGQPVTVFEVLKQFQKSNHMLLSSKVGEQRAGDLAECVGSSEKAKKVLGWEPIHTLDDMCCDAWKFKQNNPKGYRK